MKICNEYEVLVISSQKGQGLMFPKVLQIKQFHMNNFLFLSIGLLILIHLVL